ncbi:hypothetical protein V499_01683 [Pseudogymnoascus sp. VKM F-103]|nr:hypothetical protein V499_01683 [Pseudogymnoascus sp. VKM F-103]
MTSIQWDSLQFYQPPNQGIKEITQDQDSRDAVVRNAEIEILSVDKPLLLSANRDFADVGDGLDGAYGPATDSNQVKWGTSQDKAIVLDSDVDSNGEFDNVERRTPLDLTMRDAILSHSHPISDTAYIPRSTYNLGVAEPTNDEGLRQAEASSILSQNDTSTATEINGVLLLASQNIESPIGLGCVQETSAISITEGIPTNEGKIDKYQPKSRTDSNYYPSAENDHMDRIELSLGMTRSDDRGGSIDDTDGEDHANDSSGSDIEHPQRLKRRRRAKSTDSSAQTNFSNVKGVAFPTNSSDVLS